MVQNSTKSLKIVLNLLELAPSRSCSTSRNQVKVCNEFPAAQLHFAFTQGTLIPISAY